MELISPSQAAALLGVTTQTVTRWIHLGKLPATRVMSNQWCIKASDIVGLKKTKPGRKPRGLHQTP